MLHSRTVGMPRGWFFFRKAMPQIKTSAQALDSRRTLFKP
jgi:hypothetical protein